VRRELWNRVPGMGRMNMRVMNEIVAIPFMRRTCHSTCDRCQHTRCECKLWTVILYMQLYQNLMEQWS
jgi:hypothetical protein